MSTPTSSTACATPAALRAALIDWARTDGLTWIYLAKALLAAFLALGIAMKLELPQPRTAMTTVFIVMQPQSGMVFAKSFYRICGTLVGLVVMMVLIALFAQQPELFIACTALWVGICTAGAARNRNFRSYGFVLAGYTAALIGIPASQNPDAAWLSALTRVAEVTLGIVCSGAVSALVFPQHTGEQMRSTVRARFSAFVEYVGASLSGKVDRAGIEATNARFVADIVGFEAARSAAIFEGPETRRRKGRLARLNSEFMTASTRFHALHQLMNRLHAAGAGTGASAAVSALEPYFHELSPLLRNADEPVLSAADAAAVTTQLEQWKNELPRRIRITRATLEHEANAPLLDFDTGAELLVRFVDDLHAYAATYASLAVDTHARERWIERYQPKTNAIAAGVAGLRATLVMMALGAFWIATAWPSGSTLTLNAAAICALASSSPTPTRTAFQMAAGTLLATIAGMLVTFGVYPHIDGFALLCVALAPCLLFGVWMTTRPKLAGYGMGYCIFFCFLAGPDNYVLYNPTSFMNDAMALVLSMLVASIAFGVLLPPSHPWLRARLLADLRRQVVLACKGRLGGRLLGRRTRFESGARDLMVQINALTAQAPDARRDTLRWLFAVLETGNALIDLRGELVALPREPEYAKHAPWRVELRAMRDALAALFDVPDTARHQRAAVATRRAIDAAQQVIATRFATAANPATDAATNAVTHEADTAGDASNASDSPASNASRDDRHRMQRILSHLHFIRTALLDPQSPLGALAARGATEGVDHAS